MSFSNHGLPPPDLAASVESSLTMSMTAHLDSLEIWATLPGERHERTCVYRRRKRDIANKMRRKKKREERKRGRKESILLPQGLQSSSGLAWLCSVSVSSGLRLFPPLVCSACWPPALHQSLSGVRHQFHCEMGRPIGKLVAPHTLVLSLVYEKPSPHPVGSAGPVMDSWYFPFMALMK